jgi:hypothetical protein
MRGCAMLLGPLSAPFTELFVQHPSNFRVITECDFFATPGVWDEELHLDNYGISAVTIVR